MQLTLRRRGALIDWTKVEEKTTDVLEQLRSILKPDMHVSASGSVWIKTCVGYWIGLEIRVGRSPEPSCWLWTVDLVARWVGLDIAISLRFVGFDEPKDIMRVDAACVTRHLQEWLQRNLYELGGEIKVPISPEALEEIRRELATALPQPAKS